MINSWQKCGVILLLFSFGESLGQFLNPNAIDEYLPTCGSTQYAPRRYFCCNEQLYPRWNNDSCCGDTPYDSGKQMCCNGRLSARRYTHQCCASRSYNACHRLCCGGNSYDMRHYMCCGGVARWRGNGFRCCGTQTYRKLDQLCCGGKPYSKQRYVCSRGRAIRKELANHTHACGKDKTYHSDQHLCCENQLVPRHSRYDVCCGETTYNKHFQQCCGEDVVSRSRNDSCCRSGEMSIPYGSEKHICCNGKLSVITLNVTICCGTNTFDISKEVCCNNVVLSKISPNTGCCTKNEISTVFNKNDQICCDGNLYSRRKYTACCLGTNNKLPYHESLEICCDGQKFPKMTFNKCCYSPLGHAIPYNSSNHLCCDGSLHHGTVSTHLCCGGKSIPKPEPNAASPHYDCCGTDIYDTITQICCNGKIYEKIQYDACCFPADQPYHSSVSTCCCDKIHDKHRFDGCCAGRGYNTRTHTCCWPVVHKKRKGHKCCNGAAALFHVFTQRCCSGSVVTGKVCSPNAISRQVNHLSDNYSKKSRLPGVSINF